MTMRKHLLNIGAALAVIAGVGAFLVQANPALAQKAGSWITPLPALRVTEGYLQVTGEGTSTTDTVTTSIGAASTSVTLANDVSGNKALSLTVDGDGATAVFGTPQTTAGSGVMVFADSTGGVVLSDQVFATSSLSGMGLAYSYDVDAATAKGLLIGEATLSSGAATVTTGSSRIITGCVPRANTTASVTLGVSGKGTRTYTIDDGSGSSTYTVFYICETSGALG